MRPTRCQLRYRRCRILVDSGLGRFILGFVLDASVDLLNANLHVSIARYFVARKLFDYSSSWILIGKLFLLFATFRFSC